MFVPAHPPIGTKERMRELGSHFLANPETEVAFFLSVFDDLVLRGPESFLQSLKSKMWEILQRFMECSGIYYNEL